LTPAQRQSLIETYPARIGVLDGIPVEARDGANRIVLGMVTAGLLARRQEFRTGAPGDRLKRMAQVRVIDAQLAGIRAIERRLGPPQSGQQQAYLLGLNTDDFGQAIVAIGNPDTADNVVTFVPGTYSSLGGAAGGLEKVENMVDAVGYDAPQSLGEASDTSYAHRAGGDLDRFQHGLRATHVGPPSNNTLIAHSYGSTVAGVTARDHGLAIDNTVFVGSPGVGADHARELGLPADSVWATRADNDVIQHAYDHPDLRTPVHPLVPTGVPNPDPDLVHGNDPTDADFGARVFGSDPGTSMWSDPQAAHSEYWDKRTKSLRNFGYIIVDRPDLVKP
jgi:pimeloyl-ACP methyl ester carboxylesterase